MPATNRPLQDLTRGEDLEKKQRPPCSAAKKTSTSKVLQGRAPSKTARQGLLKVALIFKEKSFLNGSRDLSRNLLDTYKATGSKVPDFHLQHSDPTTGGPLAPWKKQREIGEAKVRHVCPWKLGRNS